MPFEEEDPVIASYDVYISPSNTDDASTTTKKPLELYVLQYPSHRPSTKPYNTSRSQKPISLRLKANTGIIEVDVPILTSDNYSLPLGSQFGKAMHESRVAHPLTTHGLSGGFSHNQTSINNPIHPSDLPQHGIDTTLHTQTLGGKMSTNTDKDPIYMLATLKPNSHELHLQHLDGVVQLRPQLHHIDAAEEIKKRVETTANRAKSSAGTANADPSAPVKLETKAIELKLKDQSKGDDPKDRNQNLNARLLRDIQNDPWVRYDWIETQHNKDLSQIPAALRTAATTDTTTTHPHLKAALDNDEWLNKMSSPGIELRTRLKGRDRERARRKRQERARAARGEVTAAALAQEIVSASGSDTDASDDEDAHARGQMDGVEFGSSTNAHKDADNDTNTQAPEPTEPTNSADERPGTGTSEIQIKQEAPVPTPSSVPLSTSPTTSAAAPKRRGRPPKSKAG